MLAKWAALALTCPKPSFLGTNFSRVACLGPHLSKRRFSGIQFWLTSALSQLRRVSREFAEPVVDNFPWIPVGLVISASVPCEFAGSVEENFTWTPVGLVASTSVPREVFAAILSRIRG